MIPGQTSGTWIDLIKEMGYALVVVKAIIAVAVGQITIYFGVRLIERLKQPRQLGDGRRASTIRGVLKSLLRFIVNAIVIFILLDMLGVRTSSLLAGAGLVGLAVGFGAQNLIKDVLSGLFIIYEDEFSVGDHVSTAGVSGVVEEMGLTVVKIRDFGGELHFVPYGAADKVTNYSRGEMRAIVEIPVSYDESPHRVLDALTEACRSVAAANKNIKEGPTVLGITSLDQRGVVYTIVAKADPMQQWAVEREIRREIWDAFGRVDIRPPETRVKTFS